jgi:hypothetical protein
MLTLNNEDRRPSSFVFREFSISLADWFESGHSFTQVLKPLVERGYDQN